VFFTYGDNKFKAGRERLAAEARATGDFTEVYAYDPTSLEPEFVAKNKAVLSAPRGGGYWIWKSHIAQRLLKSMQPGDVLMYADAGCTFLSSAREYIDHARRYGAVFFRMDGLYNRDWAKGDLFEALGLDPNGIIGRESQVMSTVWIMHKEPAVDALVDRWAALAQTPALVNDARSVRPNAATFREHRHDQAIMSLLVRVGAGDCLAPHCAMTYHARPPRPCRCTRCKWVPCCMTSPSSTIRMTYPLLCPPRGERGSGYGKGSPNVVPLESQTTVHTYKRLQQAGSLQGSNHGGRLRRRAVGVGAAGGTNVDAVQEAVDGAGGAVA